MPYSGQIYPDGHTDHNGAWPADVYYADMDGIWTDNAVQTQSGLLDPRNINIPGDGKFDQSVIPYSSGPNANNNAELELGRIDMYDLPLFAKNEFDLMKDYLDRNHNYRTKITSYPAKGIWEDGFNAYHGTVTNSWPKLLSNDSITNGDYLSSLQIDSYLWSYGAGGGGWGPGPGDSLNYIASTRLLSYKPINTVFTMLFGSWVGDWDHPNSIMRGSLAAGALTCVWSGRPEWDFSDMAYGSTIGNSNLFTQNKTGPFQKSIHISLLGDPTLANYVVAAPRLASPVSYSYTPQGVVLKWIPSRNNRNTSTILNMGYNIYIEEMNGTYIKLNAVPMNDTSFTTCEKSSYSTTTKYVVKGIAQILSNVDAFFQESAGISITVDNYLTANFKTQEMHHTILRICEVK